MLFSSSSCLVVLLAVEDPQDGEEQIDDIQVKADCRRDLLFDVVVPHDQLRIHEYIAAEDERADNAVA